MRELKREESGWVVALSWLSALEEVARDFHGTRPRAFCQRAYEHATENFLRILENEYGIKAQRVDSIKKAVEEYIRVGVKGRLFTDASQFELTETNPNRLELVVHKCPYLKSCEALLKEGIRLKDLTCARIGAFRAAALHLADIDCTYEVTAFAIEETCRGSIERK
jgi:hypothetical protein